MNKDKSYSYADKRLRIDRAHRGADAEGLRSIHISVLVKHTGWLISDWMSRQLESHGLSFSSYVALVSLYGIPGGVANPSELCLCTGETRANMTRIADELVSHGLIDRITSVEDRRRVDLTLTEKGRALMDDVMPALRERLGRVLNVFSDEEKTQLEQVLFKLMRAFENEA